MDDQAELEEALRTTLRRGSVDPPGPAFTARVMDSLPQGGDVRGRGRLTGLTLAAISVVIVVAAIRATVPSLDPPSAGGGAGASAPSPASSLPLVRERLWELVVQAPAAWAVEVHGTRADWNGQELHAVGSMGTVPVEQTCELWAPPPEYSGHVPFVCTTEWDPSAEIQVRVEHVGVDVGAWGQWGMVSQAAPAGAERITIDGVGAQVRVVDGEGVPDTRELVSGAARIIVWDLPSPASLWTSYRVTAVMRGNSARVDALDDQVRGVVESIRYAPPFTWDLPADDPAGALRAGLGALREQDADSPSIDASCFPDEPGGRRETRVAQPAFLGYELTQPLDVTCSSAIEPTAFRRWKMTLRYDWAATDRHDAGHAELVVVLDKVAGVVGFGGDAFGIDAMPYLRPIEGINEG